MSTTFKVIIVSIILIFSSSIIASPIDLTTPIQLDEAKFFVFDKYGNRHLSQTLQYSKNTEYGWEISFRSTLKNHNLTEVVTLPAPTTWGVSANTTISLDRRSATSKYHLKSPNGKFTHAVFWKYAAGDPPGIYLFDIYIDGKKIKSFRIMVSL